MGSIAAGDVVRTTARMLLDGIHDVVNVYHHKALNTNLGDDAAFMAGMAVGLDNAHTLINPSLSSRLTYVTIEGLNVTAARLLPTVGWPTLVAGLTGTDMLPETVAACVFFRTVRPKTRAAKFLAAYTETSNEGGAVSASSVTLLQAYGDLLVADIPADGAVMEYGAYNDLVARFTLVNAAIVPARWRTQRRRRFGVGS